MDVTESLKRFIFKAFIVFFALCTLLWLSIIFYGLLYYLYIPAVAHIRSVHLQYDMSCFRGKQCRPKFPFDNITLMESGNEFLRGGQGYAVELVLEMPESERNWIQGVFMIKLDMINFEGRIIKSTHRAAMLRYRSPLFKTFYTLFFMPGLLAGSFEEKQCLVVPLFEEYIEDSYNSAHFAHVEIQAQTLEVYSSSLRIHAQFTGLRYLMYYWPITSAVIGVGGNFLCLVVTFGLIWFFESTRAASDENFGQLRNLRQFQSKNNRADESLNEIIPPMASDVPRCEKENIENENEPRHSEPENRRIMLQEVDIFNQLREIENMPGQLEPSNDGVPQVEAVVAGTERENIDVENLPRYRAVAMNQLRDDDD